MRELIRRLKKSACHIVTTLLKNEMIAIFSMVFNDAPINGCHKPLQMLRTILQIDETIRKIVLFHSINQ